MKFSVREAARQIEEAGGLKRLKLDQSDQVITFVSQLLGRPLPSDLEDFYRENIAEIGEFPSYIPWWNAWMGRWESDLTIFLDLFPAEAAPLFNDGCGNVYALDLSSGDATPAVYFFDHEHGFHEPRWAAGSSLGTFLLLLAESDRSIREGWPASWRRAIDPDLDKCPRAPMEPY